jgi:hypothetical protein
MASLPAVSALPWDQSTLDVDPQPGLPTAGVTLACLCLGRASALAFWNSGIMNRTSLSSTFHGHDPWLLIALERNSGDDGANRRARPRHDVRAIAVFLRGAGAADGFAGEVGGKGVLI